MLFGVLWEAFGSAAAFAAAAAVTAAAAGLMLALAAGPDLRPGRVA